MIGVQQSDSNRTRILVTCIQDAGQYCAASLRESLSVAEAQQLAASLQHAIALAEQARRPGARLATVIACDDTGHEEIVLGAPAARDLAEGER